EEAIVEYELAQVAVPLASIDLQIARAYDRLGSPRLAAEGYRRYLAGDPHAADGPEVRLRIAQLEQQQPRAPAPVAAPAIVAPVEPAPVRRAPRYLAPLLVLDLAVPLLIVGGALVGTVDADVDNLRRTCAPRCAPSQLSGLETREQAGYALIGIGAAAAVADAILWFVAYRKRRGAGALLMRPPIRSARRAPIAVSLAFALAGCTDFGALTAQYEASVPIDLGAPPDLESTPDSLA